MEVVRDLIRDLVGIIFPGSLLVIFTAWMIFGIAIVVFPSIPINIQTFADNSVGIFALLIFSYIGGQFLRLKKLNEVEKVCTLEYRKKVKSNLTKEMFDSSVKRLEQADEKFYSGGMSREELKREYEEHTHKFGLWEKYPYPYHVRGRNLLLQSEDYNEFYENFDRQGVARTKRFFDYCKTAVYELSPALKEEAIRQEALIRLFAGIYYVIKYAIRVNLFLGIGHLIIAIFFLLKLSLPIYGDLSTSIIIVTISVIVISIFIYLKQEVIEHLRFARMKELNLIFDGYYLVSEKMETKRKF